jgi:hypothetical protein
MIFRINPQNYGSDRNYLGPGADGGAGGFLKGAPQPVPIVAHIATRSIILNNLFFIAVNVYRDNIGKKVFVCKITN